MIDFTDAPKLKKGYGGANGNKISILLNDSRWMLKFPSISERNSELHYTKGCISEIENIILDTPGIDQAEKEFYTGILKARKENILDYSANQLSREKGAMTLTKELKRTVDRSLAAKEISSTEAAKKYSEVQNSQSGKDEILNEPNVKAADGSHFKGSSDNACL